MPSTARGLPYPLPTAPVAAGAADIQALAEAVDPRLGSILLGTQSLLANQANFDTNVILGGAIPATYKELRVLAFLRSNAAAVGDAAYVQFNGDVGANYDREYQQAFGATANAGENFGLPGVQIPVCNGGSSPADLYTVMDIRVPFYTLPRNKVCRADWTAKYSATTGDMRIGYVGGFWRSNAVINRIVIAPQTGTAWVTGCAVYLFGVA